MQHLQPNTTLQGGRYKIKDVLGQGGFGITYLAKDNSLGVYVAVKEFFMKDLCSRDEVTQTMNSSGGSLKQVERYREKFIKEARNLSRLHHLHIISVIDVFEENGTVYYSMPYLKGGSLQDYVKSRGPLTEVEAMKIIRQIADALKYMHEVEHICHYDVKPSNILLDDRGNAMLIDFGIAKNYDESGHETSTTPIGMSEGYAPIEQYQQNVEEFSPASDVYGLGATLLFAMTGKRPTSVIERVGGTPLEMPRYCSEPIKELIFSSMIIQRKYRPQSTKKFLEYDLPKVAPSPVVATSDEITLVDQEPRQSYRNVDNVDERTFTDHQYNNQNVQPHTSHSPYSSLSHNNYSESEVLWKRKEDDNKKIASGRTIKIKIDYTKPSYDSFLVSLLSIGSLCCILIILVLYTYYGQRSYNPPTDSLMESPLFMLILFLSSFSLPIMTSILYGLLSKGLRSYNKDISTLLGLCSFLTIAKLLNDFILSNEVIGWFLFYVEQIFGLMCSFFILTRCTGNIVFLGKIFLFYYSFLSLLNFFSITDIDHKFGDTTYSLYSVVVWGVDILWLYGMWWMLTRKEKANDVLKN